MRRKRKDSNVVSSNWSLHKIGHFVNLNDTIL